MRACTTCRCTRTAAWSTVRGHCCCCCCQGWERCTRPGQHTAAMLDRARSSAHCSSSLPLPHPHPALTHLPPAGLLYECELEELLKQRTEVEEDKDLRVVGYRKYKAVSPSAFGLDSRGKKAIAVVRTSGAIVGGSGGTGGSITAGAVISQLRALKKNKVRWGGVLRLRGRTCVGGPLFVHPRPPLPPSHPSHAPSCSPTERGGSGAAYRLARRRRISQRPDVAGDPGAQQGQACDCLHGGCGGLWRLLHGHGLPQDCGGAQHHHRLHRRGKLRTGAHVGGPGAPGRPVWGNAVRAAPPPCLTHPGACRSHPPAAQVTGKFNLAELYRKLGYNKELISRCAAELLAGNTPGAGAQGRGG